MKPYRTITQKQFNEVKKRFLKHYGIKVRNSLKWYNAIKIRLLKKYLNKAGMSEIVKSIKSRTLCLCTWKRTFLFHPGTMKRKTTSGRHEILRMLVHEAEHHVQCDGKPVTFYSRYASSRSERAEFEGYAHGAEIDLSRVFGGDAGEAESLFNQIWCRMYKIKHGGGAHRTAIRCYNIQKKISDPLNGKFASEPGRVMCEILSDVLGKN